MLKYFFYITRFLLDKSMISMNMSLCLELKQDIINVVDINY